MGIKETIYPKVKILTLMFKTYMTFFLHCKKIFSWFVIVIFVIFVNIFSFVKST